MDRIRGIWGCHYSIPKAIFYLIKRDYRVCKKEVTALKGSQLAMHEGLEKKCCDPFLMARAAFLVKSGFWGCVGTSGGNLGVALGLGQGLGLFLLVAIIFSFVGVGTVVAFLSRFPRKHRGKKKKRQKKNKTDQQKARASSLRIGGVLFELLKSYPLSR